MLYGQAVVWTERQGIKRTVVSAGCASPEAALARALELAVAEGWTSPRWWQWWRWADRPWRFPAAMRRRLQSSPARPRPAAIFAAVMRLIGTERRRHTVGRWMAVRHRIVRAPFYRLARLAPSRLVGV